MSTYIDIVFEGDKFSPNMLGEGIGMPIESIAEYGEIGKKGRYKDKALPYGLGLLKITGHSSEEFNEKLNQVFDLLSLRTRLLRKTGLREIKIDKESSSLDGFYFDISEGIYDKILKINNELNIAESRFYCDFINDRESQQIILTNLYESMIADEQFHISNHDKDRIDYLFTQKLSHSRIFEYHFSYNEAAAKIFLYILKYSKSKKIENIPDFDEIIKE